MLDRPRFDPLVARRSRGRDRSFGDRARVARPAGEHEVCGEPGEHAGLRTSTDGRLFPRRDDRLRRVGPLREGRPPPATAGSMSRCHRPARRHDQVVRGLERAAPRSPSWPSAASTASTARRAKSTARGPSPISSADVARRVRGGRRGRGPPGGPRPARGPTCRSRARTGGRPRRRRTLPATRRLRRSRPSARGRAYGPRSSGGRSRRAGSPPRRRPSEGRRPIASAYAAWKRRRSEGRSCSYAASWASA